MFDFSYYSKLYKDELFENVLPFWDKYGMDKTYGGITTCLDRSGGIYSYDKSVWMQGRTAYIYSLLYNTYDKRADWLQNAKSCLDFLDGHCIDKADGRMYFTVTKEGKPLRKRRYYFSETFYIIACAEYYGATNNPAYLEKARKYFKFVTDIYCDPPSDPYKITPKSIAATRNTKSLACPMILLNVNSVLRKHDPVNARYYDKTAEKLIADILRFKTKDGLMLENIGADNAYLPESSAMRIVNPGHSIELSWFLLDEAIHRHDNSLAKTAENIFRAAFEYGWDERYGGLLYFKDIENKPVEAYEHDMKLWWPQTEALIGALKFYSRTKNEAYLNIFKKTHDYAFNHFSDPEYGEWFGYLRRDGAPTEPPCKGHTYKGPFHIPRMLILCHQILASEK